MKNSWSLIAAAAALIAILFFISTSGKKPPVIPRDAIHTAITTQEGCSACHAPGKQSPLHGVHPPKEQCLVCHKRDKS